MIISFGIAINLNVIKFLNKGYDHSQPEGPELGNLVSCVCRMFAILFF